MERGVRAGHRRRPGAVGRVRAVRVHQRHHRAVLPAVRPDHRRLDDHLGVQLADAQPGPGRPAAASRSGAKRTCSAGCSILLLGWFFRLFNCGFRRATERLHARRRPGAARQRRRAGASTAACSALTYVGLQPACRPATFRRQDKGYLLRQPSSCPTPPRWSGRRRSSTRSTRSCHETPRRRPHHRRSPASRSRSAPTARTSASSSSPSTTFDERRDPNAVQRPPSPPSCANASPTEIPDAERGRLRPAAGVRPRLGRRLQVHHRGPRRPGDLDALQKQTDNLVAAANKDRQGSKGLFTVFRANSPQLYVDIEPRPVPDAWASTPSDVFSTLQIYLGSLLRQRLQPLRPHLAGGRPGRRRRSATTSSDVKRLKVRNAAGEHGAARRRAQRPRDRRPAHPRRATTCTPPPPSSAPRRPASAPARRIEAMERPGRRGAAAGHGLRVDRDQLTCRSTLPGNIWNNLIFPLARGVRVPGAGGAVRKLVAAAGRHPRRADVHLLGSLAGVGASPARRHQHLHADRLRRAGRPGEQERDPDRRVRQAQARGGPVAARGDAGGVPAAAAADPDDLVRLHPRRRAADRLARAPARRCGRRWAPPSSAACSA